MEHCMIFVLGIKTRSLIGKLKANVFIIVIGI